MIEEHVKIHDKFSVEIKVGFVARRKQKHNRFLLNIWTFMPNSLDINRFTYSKDDFYRDLKSNIRLITPFYLLRDILENDSSPFVFIEKAFVALASQPTRTNKAEYEYQIKMFLSILKSSLREEVNHIIENSITHDDDYLVREYVKNVSLISAKYRSLQRIINTPTVGKDLMVYFDFGNEFMSNVIEFHCFKLMDGLKQRGPKKYESMQKNLQSIINDEISYRKSHGFKCIEEDSKGGNHDFVFHLGMLKKYAESHLFLSIKKRKDGVVAEQLLFSLAAGISMVFATIIAFSFQKTFGNFTLPLFIALVVSYMLKDRIKEFARFYFAHKMGSRYFDHKVDMSISGHEIGWVKEGMDFISENKVPEDILKVRDRSSILEANNRANKERVILYRTQMFIDRDALEANCKYPVSGINDIIRFNVSNLIQKMDNPSFPLYYPDEKEGYKVIKGEKVYYLNFVVQMQHDSQLEYQRYRIMFNRKGIKQVEMF